jgi:uncharacterized protein (TIGR00251 family)
MTLVHVKVTPHASKNSFAGWQGEILRIRLHATPEKGRANEELIAFLADALNIAKSNIRILSGGASRSKRIEITGKTMDEIRKLIIEK